MDLSWQHYTEWLMRIHGMGLNDAIAKTGKTYEKQHGGSFPVDKADEIHEFIENYYNPFRRISDPIADKHRKRKKKLALRLNA